MKYALVYLLTIGWSPFFLGYLNLSPVLIYIPVLTTVGAYLLIKNNQSKAAIYQTLCVAALIFLGTLTSGSKSYLIFFFNLPISLFVCITLLKKDPELIESVTKILSIIVYFGILTSWIGFFYALNNGQPLIIFDNPDGRQNGLFLSTFSNTQIGNIIRPSFIFDEPGAFSFLIISTVALRDRYNLSKVNSTSMLLGGLITLSIAHIIILLVYLVWGNKKVFFIAITVIAIAFSTTYNNNDFNFFYKRLEIEDGQISGDNRSNQIENFLNIANSDIILFGNYECHTRPNRICPEHGDISSSPVTPIYLGGTLLLLIQAYFHVLLIIIIAKCKRLRPTAIAFSILILQRPFFSSYGYQIMIILVVLSMFAAAKSESLNFNLPRQDTKKNPVHKT